MGAYFVLFPSRARHRLVAGVFLPRSSSSCQPSPSSVSGRSRRCSAGHCRLRNPATLGGVAWWAHAGGFAAGIALHRSFVYRGPSYRPWRATSTTLRAPGCRPDIGGCSDVPRRCRLAVLPPVGIQPVLKQRFLEASRQRLIARIERQRESRVILLVHRQETMSLLGFPVFRYIDVNDSEEVLRAIHLTDKAVPLDIVLHTPGGLVLAALQIARAIHKHQGKVTRVRAALRHVGRNTDRTGGRRDRDERVRGASDRSIRSWGSIRPPRLSRRANKADCGGR